MLFSRIDTYIIYTCLCVYICVYIYKTFRSFGKRMPGSFPNYISLTAPCWSLQWTCFFCTTCYDQPSGNRRHIVRHSLTGLDFIIKVVEQVMLSLDHEKKTTTKKKRHTHCLQRKCHSGSTKSTSGSLRQWAQPRPHFLISIRKKPPREEGNETCYLASLICQNTCYHLPFLAGMSMYQV